jgi:site-specific recombinase XerD
MKYSEFSNIRPQIHPHTFRHKYFTLLAEQNISKETRMLIAGHTNEKTQDIYTHLSIGGVKDNLIKILDSN